MPVKKYTHFNVRCQTDQSCCATDNNRNNGRPPKSGALARYPQLNTCLRGEGETASVFDMTKQAA